MPDATDLRRRMDAAIRNPRLHPSYARQLLREAREALVAGQKVEILVAEWVDPGTILFEQNGEIVGRIVNVRFDP